MGGLSARALGGVLKIDWICRKDLPFQKVQHLYNPWNDGKPIKIGRDGQEIEPKVAEELCRLFSVDENVDMTPILRKSKESARNQRAKPLSERKPISGPGSRGPISGSRDRFPGPPGGGRGGYRKRRYEDRGRGSGSRIGIEDRDRGSGSRIGIEDRDRGSGSRIWIEDLDQGLGSRIGIKDRDQGS